MSENEAIKNSRELILYWNNRKVGTIIEKSHKPYLIYDESWLNDPQTMAISLSLPKIKEAQSCYIFLKNLQHEGQSLKEIVFRKDKQSNKDLFTYFEKFGEDCAGALTLIPESKEIENQEPLYQNVTLKIEEILKQGKSREKSLHTSLLDMNIKLNFSIAGAQDKIAIFYKDNQYHVPLNSNSPTNYILKSDSVNFDAVPENELFCLSLARICGFKVPRVEIKNHENFHVFLIERYDRKINKNNNTILRLHQEDFCQALKIPPMRKYGYSLGPNFPECLTILKKLTNPQQEINNFIKQSIFNFIIGNSDAHAKNFSISYHEDNQLTLSPVYDILSTQVYENLIENMAMNYGGRHDPEKIDNKSWKIFADNLEITIPELTNIMSPLLTNIEKKYPILMKNFYNKYKNFSIINEALEIIINKRINNIKQFCNFYADQKTVIAPPKTYYDLENTLHTKLIKEALKAKYKCVGSYGIDILQDKIYKPTSLKDLNIYPDAHDTIQAIHYGAYMGSSPKKLLNNNKHPFKIHNFRCYLPEFDKISEEEKNQDHFHFKIWPEEDHNGTKPLWVKITHEEADILTQLGVEKYLGLIIVSTDTNKPFGLENDEILLSEERPLARFFIEDEKTAFRTIFREDIREKMKNNNEIKLNFRAMCF